MIMFKIILIMMLVALSSVVSAKEFLIQNEGKTFYFISGDSEYNADYDGCKGQNYNGLSGWRQPTLAELLPAATQLKNNPDNPWKDLMKSYYPFFKLSVSDLYQDSSGGHIVISKHRDNSDFREMSGSSGIKVSAFACVSDMSPAPVVVTPPAPVKTDNYTIELKAEPSAAANEAARQKAAAAAKVEEAKRQAEEDRAYRAEQKAKAEKRAADQAARDEKQRAWCMADQSRLQLCSCSKFSSVKGSACGK